MCVAMTVYGMHATNPRSRCKENFLEAVLARRPPIISVEGREMDRSGNFERRSFSYNRVFGKGEVIYVYT